MCSQRYYGYALFCVLLMCWTLQVEYRNSRFPEVRDVVLQNQDGTANIHYQISNPGSEKARVATHVRLQPSAESPVDVELFSSPVTIVEFDLEPRSKLDILLPV